MRPQSLLSSTAWRPLLSVSSQSELVSSTSTMTFSSADLPSHSGSAYGPTSLNFSTARAAARCVSTRGQWGCWAAAGLPAPPAGTAKAVAAPPEGPRAESAAPPAEEPPAAEAAAPPPEQAPAGEALAPPPEQPPDAEAAAPPPPEEPASPEAAAPPPEEPAPSEAAAPAKPSQKIELIIDSLQGFELNKPIPVLVERLAEKKFKATVPESDITSAGPTMGEAFLQLKDQIERSYAKYHNQKNLEPEQQRQFEILQKYVLRERRRSSWSFR